MTYKKVGGIHFMTLGRLGVNFYVKKAKPTKRDAVSWSRRFAMFAMFAMSWADQCKLEMELAQ